MPSLGHALALAPDIRDGLTRAARSFGRVTRERGERYARQGRVTSISLQDDGITASVRGTATYRVHWERLRPDDRDGWIGRCSCPVGLYCKHAYAVATILLGGEATERVPSEIDDHDVDGEEDRQATTFRERSDASALARIRESPQTWQRHAAADSILKRAGLGYDAIQRVVAAANLDGSDPDLRCWRLATEVARVAGSEHVPPVLAPFLDRPDLEQRVLERKRAGLRRDLLAWAGRTRIATPRTLRVVLDLEEALRERVALTVELHVGGARGESSRTPAQLKQLHGEVRDEPRLLPVEQAELLAIVVEHLSTGTSSGASFAVGLHLPIAPLRLLLQRGAALGLIAWSEDLDPALARRGGLAPGAPLRLVPGAAQLVPSCTSRDGATLLDLALVWPDGRSIPYDDALQVSTGELWRGDGPALAVAGGELAFLGSAPPSGLVERFRAARGLPLAPEERVPLLAQLGTRWPHLREVLDAHTRVVAVEPVVTLDLREDDWLQIRVAARRCDAGAVVARDGFVLAPADERWERVAVVPGEDAADLAALGAVAAADHAAEKIARHADAGADTGVAAPDAHDVVDASPPAGPGSHGPHDIEVWQETPEPARVAPVASWLRATAAFPGTRRGPGGIEPPWADRATGSWLRLTSKRIGPFFAEWERRPTGVLYLGNERARRLLGPAQRALPKVRVHASGVDFLAVSAEWQTEAAGLSPEDVAALRRATTRFVRLSTGWTRKPEGADDAVESALADLGVDVGGGEQRLTLWQLAGARAESLDALAELGADADTMRAVRELRARVASFGGLPRVALPRTLRAKLRPYQRDGLDFLAFTADLGSGAILADDMGLGKTVQTLAWIEHLRRLDPDGGPALVVCPASVVHNWRREAERFVPSLRVLVLERGGERHALRAEIARHDLVITNYALLRRDAAAWSRTELRAAILDEAQNVKNPDAAVTRAALGLSARHRLALTGTPLENRPLDLFSIASFVCPGYLGTRAQFVARFDHPELPAASRVLLAAKLRPLLLRRLKRDVATELPERIEERRDCELTPGQRRLYLAELAKSRDLVERLEGEPDGLRRNRITILAALTRLRQVCCHPLLTGGKAELGSGKLEALFELLEPLLAEGHKVLVFSQFVALLKILERELAARGFAHHVLTGETVGRERVLHAFAADSRPGVFLLSLKAGGTGLNLTAASYVVLFDPWWNPAVEAQAIDRSHRIGQDRTVIAYRLIARGTIEEKIAELQEKKASLVRELLGDGGGAGSRALTREDLAFLLAPVDDS